VEAGGKTVCCVDITFYEEAEMYFGDGGTEDFSIAILICHGPEMPKELYCFQHLL
jgi:hypothetical protein